jgi:hypothetical protein
VLIEDGKPEKHLAGSPWAPSELPWVHLQTRRSGRSLRYTSDTAYERSRSCMMAPGSRVRRMSRSQVWCSHRSS